MRKIPLLILLALIFNACGKRLVYFQEKEESSNQLEKILLAPKPNPRGHIITNGDILNVQMNTVNTAVMEKFNLGRMETEGQSGPSGVMVDEEGYVFLPVAGKLKVNGLTLAQAESMLIDTLANYLTDFHLSLKLSGFRVVVLGAVKQPGVKILTGDQATLIDALSISGDLMVDGRPSEMKIIRDVNGEKKTIIADLSDLDVFRSEAYYLQSNDIIYIEPLQRRYVRENLQYITLFTTLINLATIIIFRAR
jgi:polysaccharide export outer membrane protein